MVIEFISPAAGSLVYDSASIGWRTASVTDDDPCESYDLYLYQHGEYVGEPIALRLDGQTESRFTHDHSLAKVHIYSFAWEVPPQLPSGDYAVMVSCPAVSGAAVLSPGAFSVRNMAELPSAAAATPAAAPTVPAVLDLVLTEDGDDGNGLGGDGGGDDEVLALEEAAIRDGEVDDVPLPAHAADLDDALEEDDRTQLALANKDENDDVGVAGDYAQEYDDDAAYAEENDDDAAYAEEYDDDAAYVEEYDDDAASSQEYDDDAAYAEENDDDAAYAEEYDDDAAYAEEKGAMRGGDDFQGS
jgi:hypothetical protein